MDLDSLPDLQLGSDALIEFLTSGLQQLEQISGEEDAEARGLLQKLQQQTVLMQKMSGNAAGAPAMTELEIAHQIDNLDAQLSKLEASLDAADASTMQLLGQSTSKWLLDPEANPGQRPAQPLEQQSGSPAAQQAVASTVARIAGEQQGNTVSSRSSEDTTEVGSGSLQHKAVPAGSCDKGDISDGRQSATSAAQQLDADCVNSASCALQESAAADSPQDQQ